MSVNFHSSYTLPAIIQCDVSWVVFSWYFTLTTGLHTSYRTNTLVKWNRIPSLNACQDCYAHYLVWAALLRTMATHSGSFKEVAGQEILFCQLFQQLSAASFSGWTGCQDANQYCTIHARFVNFMSLDCGVILSDLGVLRNAVCQRQFLTWTVQPWVLASASYQTFKQWRIIFGRLCYSVLLNPEGLPKDLLEPLQSEVPTWLCVACNFDRFNYPTPQSVMAIRKVVNCDIWLY